LSHHFGSVVNVARIRKYDLVFIGNTAGGDFHPELNVVVAPAAESSALFRNSRASIMSGRRFESSPQGILYSFVYERILYAELIVCHSLPTRVVSKSARTEPSKS
jgi:hypothetical protein